MLRDFRLKQLLAVGAQPRERAGLVLLHEPAVTDHIGGQNRGEPALHAVALPGPETSPAPFGNPCSEECAHGPLMALLSRTGGIRARSAVEGEADLSRTYPHCLRLTRSGPEAR